MEFVIKDGILEEYNGDSEEVYIPEDVIEIGEYCFSNNKTVKRVYITGKTKVIGKFAFEYCKSLEMVLIYSKLSIIKESAFQGCKNLTSIDLPDSIKKIEIMAFYGCKGLLDIHIPKGLKVIEEGTFEDCKNIGNLIIPEGVFKIESFAFGDCHNLKNVCFPNSLVEIEEYAFFNCYELYVNEFYNKYFKQFKILSIIKRMGLHKTVKAIKKNVKDIDMIFFLFENILFDIIKEAQYYNQWIYARYLVNRQYELEDEKFVLRCPKTLDELLEGVIKSSMWYMLDDILDGDLIILLFRKKGKLDESIASILVDENGKIVEII